MRHSFKMLIFHIPLSTPEMNVQFRPAFSAGCSWVNPSASRRIRIVPRWFSGIGAPIKIRTNHELPLPSLRRHSISSRPWQRGEFVAMTAKLISVPLPWHREQVTIPPP